MECSSSTPVKPRGNNSKSVDASLIPEEMLQDVSNIIEEDQNQKAKKVLSVYACIDLMKQLTESPKKRSSRVLDLNDDPKIDIENLGSPAKRSASVHHSFGSPINSLNSLSSMVNVSGSTGSYFGPLMLKHMQSLENEVKINKDIWRRSSSKSIGIKCIIPSDLTVPFKYMYQCCEDEAEQINLRSMELARRLLKEHNIKPTEVCEKPGKAFQEIAYCLGMIALKSNISNDPKKNASVHSYSLMDFIGSVTPMLLPEEENNENDIYSIYPGQIVLVEACNPLGKLLHVKKVLSVKELSLLRPISSQCCNVNIMIVRGPMVTQSNDCIKLLDQLKTMKKNKPDILIILGPFVTEKQIENMSARNDEVFRSTMNSFVHYCSYLQVKVIIIPSCEEIGHDFVFPQPEYDSEWTKLSDNINYKKFYAQSVHFFPNPAVVQLSCSDQPDSNILIGLCSEDILLHLSGEEFCLQKSNRMFRLCHHILSSGNFYPLYPPKANCPIDYKLLAGRSFISERPHILIIPSQLNPFAMDVHGTLCINPGRLAISENKGSYAHVSIRPQLLNFAEENRSLSACVAVEIVKI